MKQFQINYKNRDDFNSRIIEIKNIHNQINGDIDFYLTWTENASEELGFIADTIEKVFPDADYYGNEASGSICMGDFTFNIIITCYIYEEKDSKTELVWVEEGTPISNLDDLWRYCESKSGLRAIEMIPSMSYVETLKIDGNVPEVPGNILIFGGASVNYDSSTYDAEIICKGHPRTQKGMAVLLYFGSSLIFSSSNILGWKGLGKLMEVTDSTGKCIKEINNEPAYSVYEKYLNLTIEDKDTLVFPLIVEEDGYEFIRTPQIIMPDKSMQMFANIPNGTKVRISYGDKNTILSQINNEARQIAEFKPEVIRAYSCAARRLFWGNDEISKETQILENIAPVCGFYTGGEILRFNDKLKVLNQTLAIVAIKENDGSSEVKDIRLETMSQDKSLVSRLAYFTEKVSEEEEQERKQLEENLDIIGGLASEYTMLYHINLDDGTFKNYIAQEKVSDMKAQLPHFTKYFDLLEAFIRGGLVYPEHVDGLRKFFIDGQEEIKHNKSISHLFKRKYGDEYLWTKIVIVKNEPADEEPHSAVLGFMECDKQINEEQERQKQLKDALTMAQSADQAKSKFLFNMSHDIRTPMNAIMGFTNMAKKYIDDEAKVIDYLGKIDTLGNQLLGLVNQVLEMARIEAGKVEIDEEPVNILDEYNSMTTILAEQAKESEVEFHHSFVDIVHNEVFTDKARVGSVVLNITGNAMKYTPRGGRVDYIFKEIEPRKPGYATYVLTVSDTGIGMSREYLSKIFEPFEREKNSTVSRTQGTGLGLSIVKNIVDLMGGEISVKSELNKGTTFDVVLDFRINDKKSVKPAESSGAGKKTLEGKRVLLVEDNELNREIARDILEEQGFIVDEAEDGDIAVDMIKETIAMGDSRYYSAIFMDIQMPRMNGFDATKAIRALDEDMASIPIIAMTANAFEEDRQNSLKAGMNEHLAKPIDINKLKEVLNKIS